MVFGYSLICAAFFLIRLELNRDECSTDSGWFQHSTGCATESAPGFLDITCLIQVGPAFFEYA